MTKNIFTLPELDFIGGASKEFVFYTYNSRASMRPFDLSGCVANFAVINFVNKGGTPAISKVMTVEEGDGDYNVMTVTLDPSDTLDLQGKYIYQVTVQDIEGLVEDPQQGVLNIHGNIDRAFLRT